MFSKSYVTFISLALLSLSDVTLGRERWLERDGRHVQLYPRRFGQEHPAVIDKLAQACPGEVCGTLSGKAITPLLAAQPECSQQDMADEIIDAAQQFDDATKQNMIELAKEYRQAEKNTPPDFTTPTPTLRFSVFCQKEPKHAELKGLVQGQDPNASGEFFFDPATKATVKKGDQANTFPFGSGNATGGNNSSSGGSAGNNNDNSSETASSTEAAATSTEAASATETSVEATATATDSSDNCGATVTVTVTSGASATETAAASSTDVAATETATATSTSAASEATSTAGAGDIGDFGSCSVPEIEFGVNFDNRKETSFQPKDKTSYDHGSAQAIGIISRFICDTLTNKCKADQTAKDTCQKATDAANAATAKTGAQADAFNAVFGITTNFADVASVDDQGRVVAGTGKAGAGNNAATNPNDSSDSGSDSTGSAGSGIGDFGKCSVPEMEFGAGFEGRKETSFQPVDKVSYNHGSAQNGAIITQFICDTLVNSCGADATAKATCATAKTAFDAAPAKTGAQADAFNAVFGIKTNFASVQALDNQGKPVGGTASTGNNNASTGNQNNNGSAATTTTSVAPAATSSAATSTPAASGDNLQTFTEALGGVAAPKVTKSGDEFQVEGNASFKQLSNALTRSCDVQNNKCANAANASGNKGDLTVAACGDQQTKCIAAHQ